MVSVWMLKHLVLWHQATYIVALTRDVLGSM